MKHEYEDSIFLFVTILPVLKSVKELIRNGFVAQEWTNKKWKENVREYFSETAVSKSRTIM